MYASSQDPSHVPPVLGLIGGLLAILFGIIAWRRRHRGRAAHVILPSSAIAAGLLCILGAAALSGIVTTAPAAPAAAVPPARQASVPGGSPSTLPTASPSASKVAPVPAPTPAPAPSPARPPATQMTMAQTLGTLQFVLKMTRGPDGLQSPALAVTSAGGVFDPFSATPNRILAILPANTTLHYTVSVDRSNYAVTLTDDANPSLVVRFDTVNGQVEIG